MPSRRFARPLVLVPLSVLVLAGVAVPAVLAATSRNGTTVTGVKDGGLIGAGQLANGVVRISGSGPAAPAVTLDGQPVPLQRDGTAYTLRLAGLRDGKHELAVATKKSWPFGSGSDTRSFTVDTTPPVLDAAPTKPGIGIKDPVDIAGRVESGAKVTADGKALSTDKGTFTLHYDKPPAVVHLVAVDAAGNTTTRDVAVDVTHPMMRGVHLTAAAWAFEGLRNPVLELARQKKIDTVELDVKEEDGSVGFDSQVPLARLAGAASKTYDARQAVDQLHGLGIRVVGRIVCFRDPKLATWAWGQGKKDLVVQTADGQPYSSGYGKISFTNFANLQVRQYNIDLAKEAAGFGFDDVLYDYVRRPDGPLAKMAFPGLGGVTPQASIAGFVADTRQAVRPQGAYLGVSVFGVAATRPKEIAQDIGEMSKYSDYISPMLYPSHWARGEYDVANPNAQPYDIVYRSLGDFQKKVQGTSAKVIPWLQDFSLGVHYGPAEVAAQLKAAFDNSIQSFLLWDAGCTYQGEALPPLPAKA